MNINRYHMNRGLELIFIVKKRNYYSNWKIQCGNKMQTRKNWCWKCIPFRWTSSAFSAICFSFKFVHTYLSLDSSVRCVWWFFFLLLIGMCLIIAYRIDYNWILKRVRCECSIVPPPLHLYYQWHCKYDCLPPVFPVHHNQKYTFLNRINWTPVVD